MLLLGNWHRHGLHGLSKDAAAAYRWHRKAADLDDPRALADSAHLTRCGIGTERNETLGVALAFQAAALGSKRGASDIGDYYYLGRHGIPKDSSRALHWYR